MEKCTELNDKSRKINHSEGQRESIIEENELGWGYSSEYVLNMCEALGLTPEMHKREKSYIHLQKY